MKNNKRIKATFSGCSGFKHLFPTSHCVVAVSVGQEANDGDRFKATLELVNNNFSECMILVGDSLQRHNLVFLENRFDNDIYQRSIDLGNEWMARNINSSNSLTIPHAIKRWDEWLKSPQFAPLLDYVKHYYETNMILNDAVNSSINEFVSRIKTRQTPNNDIAIDVMINASRNYLLEEIAILVLMLPEENYNYIIYPGKKIKALEASFSLLLKDGYKHLMQWVRVHNG